MLNHPIRLNELICVLTGMKNNLFHYENPIVLIDDKPIVAYYQSARYDSPIVLASETLKMPENI